MFELKQQRGDSTGASSENASEVLQKLAQMIDEINSNYVSKSELKTILKSAGIKVAERSETPVEAEVKKSNKELYTEAVRYYAKRQYSAAKERFIQTSKAKYKPAASNYYLGEIAYYTKNYQDATVYFKKSIELYDKAGYIDVLLLHTAISLENMGDVEKAKTFYHNIIDNYKGYKSAKIAQKRLKKL
ncbi:MAG TPA: tetratricopeptide repeat protein [Epsilonproteobacteria bacterium]|nr:tetratricopeptide repeat protein [Campylobacterota bacterium]